MDSYPPVRSAALRYGLPTEYRQVFLELVGICIAISFKREGGLVVRFLKWRDAFIEVKKQRGILYRMPIIFLRWGSCCTAELPMAFFANQFIWLQVF